jgi:hypothetical protein
MKRIIVVIIVFFVTLSFSLASAATIVPNEIQQPGTQQGEVGNLETPDKCDNCHGGYNSAVEPAFNWRGSMMANAGRDPIFWATLAIAEQDFDGSGDLCIRCHSTGGWYAGRSTPTDGSGLMAGDSDGVDCDTCHKMTNPNDQEHLGVMNPPFIANNEQTPATGYYGSGMLSLWGSAEKLGPYSDAEAKHQFLQSKFHRSVDFCGSCHDVSNPAVGDLASNNGKQATGGPVTASGFLGSPVSGKAAFNNFPYQYGIVERTYSEFYSGILSKTLVSNYAGLPADLKAGAIKAAFDSAKGNYADGTLRYFSCQTCHLRAVSGQGCNKPGVPIRSDLPLHDMTGGNYWMPDAILYQNSQNMLRLGGGLTDIQIDAINAGRDRARQQLNWAASLNVSGSALKVTNLTGHKLISGYPEGRRMWPNIKWYDSSNTLLREDGKYDWLSVNINDTPTQVKTILNLNDPNTKIYEAHYAMTKEWADQLLALGYPSSLPLGFDRMSGAVNYTLGQLAAQSSGTSHETFHFVLNDYVAKDNRIPPYGMSYDEARKRNALPVPADQYGNPGIGGVYRYWDEVTLNPPAGAAYATIDLLYQPTSWEYVQFLYLANNGQNSFLANEGVNMLQAWLNTGMSGPHIMASTTWGSAPSPTAPGAPGGVTATAGNAQATVSFTPPASNGGSQITLYTVTSNPSNITDTGPSSPITVTGLTNGTAYTFTVTATNAVGTGPTSAPSNSVTPMLPVTLTVTGVASDSIGTITDVNSINCSIAADGTASGTCTETLNSGTAVTLTASPAVAGSSVIWSGCTANIGNTCNVTLNANTTVTVSFSLLSIIRVEGSTTVATYSTIQAAFNTAMGGDIIKMRAATFNENPDFNVNVPIMLKGGFDSAFASQTGYSTIAGTLTISAGKVEVEDLIIR